MCKFSQGNLFQSFCSPPEYAFHVWGCKWQLQRNGKTLKDVFSEQGATWSENISLLTQPTLSDRFILLPKIRYRLTTDLENDKSVRGNPGGSGQPAWTKHTNNSLGARVPPYNSMACAPWGKVSPFSSPAGPGLQLIFRNI